MACRLFSFNNQQSTVRGYLAAIKFCHKLYLGWEVTTSHCVITAAGKGVDRFRGVMPSVRTVHVRERARAPGYLFDARLPDFLSWRCSG